MLSSKLMQDTHTEVFYILAYPSKSGLLRVFKKNVTTISGRPRTERKYFGLVPVRKKTF